jgi:hypothetical protein
MQTQYTTTRETIVTVKRPRGRPRKLSTHGAPITPKPWKGKIEILDGDDSTSDRVLLDGVMPRKTAELLKAVFDAL